MKVGLEERRKRRARETEHPMWNSCKSCIAYLWGIANCKNISTMLCAERSFTRSAPGKGVSEEQFSRGDYEGKAVEQGCFHWKYEPHSLDASNNAVFCSENIRRHLSRASVFRSYGFDIFPAICGRPHWSSVAPPLFELARFVFGGSRSP